MSRCNIAIVGLAFGGSFVPIYKAHPKVDVVGICDTNIELMQQFAKSYAVTKLYNSLDEILIDDEIDAVHLVTPIPFHPQQIIQVLKAGKDCACTVPLATTKQELFNILETVKSTGKKLMLMETTLHTYQFYYIKNMLENGEMGKIQFMRGCHYQDMTNWPSYWEGLPPFWYGTHALSPMIALAGAKLKSVFAFGSGTMSEKLSKKYNNPYPVESALLEFENGIKGEATRTLFETARVYKEGIDVYASKKSFEWGFFDGEAPYLTEIGEIDTTLMNESSSMMRGRSNTCSRVVLPNPYHNLPKELYHFTVGKNYDATNPQNSLKNGGGAGHHGSHPHLVDEFVQYICDNKTPYIDLNLAYNITMACIAIHQSAMLGGEKISIEEYKW